MLTPLTYLGLVELLSTVSQQSRILDCRQAIPVVSTENRIICPSFISPVCRDCRDRRGPTVDR